MVRRDALDEREGGTVRRPCYFLSIERQDAAEPRAIGVDDEGADDGVRLRGRRGDGGGGSGVGRDSSGRPGAVAVAEIAVEVAGGVDPPHATARSAGAAQDRQTRITVNISVSRRAE